MVGSTGSEEARAYDSLQHFGVETRTSSMDMEKFDDIRAELFLDYRSFIPNADIKYIGWPSRAALTKSASTIIVEFTPEDANKSIDEALFSNIQVTSLSESNH
jgi:hypothetical protein